MACFAMPQLGIEAERLCTPGLRAIPLGLSLPDGILAAVSTEAIPFGIRVGQTASGARVLCPAMSILPYDRSAYEQAAHPAWDLLATESSTVEPAAPELVYVEMSGPNLVDRTQSLVNQIASHFSIPVYAGLARTKFAALQAARRAASGQVLVVSNGREAAFLAPVAVEHIPWLDSGLQQRLERLGIHTLGDLQRLGPHELHRQLKQIGFRLHRLSMGEDGDCVRALWPPRVIEKAMTFEFEVSDEGQIDEALRRCASSISQRLVNERLFCRALSLQVSLVDASPLCQDEKLAIPISGAIPIHHAALRLKSRMNVTRPICAIKLTASDLDSASGRQLALLDLNDQGIGLPHERQQALKAALGYLDNRYGSRSVQVAKAYQTPRKVDQWSSVLGRVINKPVEVKADSHGTPVAFQWRGKDHPIECVLDRWQEDEWSGNAERLSRKVYLVQTAAYPYSELIQAGHKWTLGRRFD